VPVRNDIISRTYNWFMEGLGINDNAGNRRAFLGQNYPNPAKDGTVFPLNHVDHDMMIQITDLMGRIIVSEVVRTGAVQISVPTSSLTNGIYLCRLVSGDRVIDARKMSIQH